MHKITKTMTTETAHRLIGHKGKCSNIHGHSYLWEVSACGEFLDQDGMIMDFSKIKSAMERTIGVLDHVIVLKKGDPLIPILINHALGVVVFDENPTAEQFSEWAFFEIKKIIQSVCCVRVWETKTSFSEFSL